MCLKRLVIRWVLQCQCKDSGTYIQMMPGLMTRVVCQTGSPGHLLCGSNVVFVLPSTCVSPEQAAAVFHTIPYNTIPYHTMPYHTVPYHTNTIPYHTIPYHTIPRAFIRVGSLTGGQGVCACRFGHEHLVKIGAACICRANGPRMRIATSVSARLIGCFLLLLRLKLVHD